MASRHVFVLAVIAALATASLPADAVPGYRLQQRSDFYGASTAEVTRNSLSLHSDRLHLKLHVAAPEFQLTALNDRNRQYAKIPFKRWQGFVSDAHPKASNERVFKGYVTISGLRSEEWWVEAPRRDPVENKACKDLWYKGRSYNTHYFVTKQIAPPNDTFAVFSNALGMPGSLGLPVRMIQYTKAGKPFVTFDTVKVEKADVSEKLAVPKDYEVAADEMSLLISAAVDRKKLAALLDDDDDAFLSELNPRRKASKERRQIRGWVPGMDASGEMGTDRAKAGVEGSWVPGS